MAGGVGLFRAGLKGQGGFQREATCFRMVSKRDHRF